ncbi:hypothetical protein VitviT2T_030030 [Vitis vinifera]|uniref:Oligopeptide transporter 1 n=1 Tax=Vitis vinifera TaxID=29760 RepID=A0ABY9DZI9_VITVI|nr:hypothetical protein VitviT2T_030030 [Vitis vinifera]
MAELQDEVTQKNFKVDGDEEENDCPIEQVRLTVPITDDPTEPVLTFRTWVLGVAACVILSFVNQFFGYRSNQLSISSVSAQIVTLPLGKFMAATLPEKPIKVPCTKWSFSLNPGPFNIKEHVLITMFANSGSGGVYAVGILTIVKAFYKRSLSPGAGYLLVQTTQLLGYGWAGLFRKYLVDSPYMWWPSNLVQVSLFRALHEKEKRSKGGVTRLQFFLIVFISSFAYYLVPNYLFPSISTVSIICLIWKNSITAQQIGSGLYGMGLGSFGLDWATVASFLGSPLATPGFAIINILVGFFIIVYILLPLTYYNNAYDAKKFPIFSSHTFDSTGQPYNLTRILDPKTFSINLDEYNAYSKLYLSVFFSVTYGISFATLAAAVSHVALFNGSTIWQMWSKTRAAAGEKFGDQPGLNVITELIIGFMYPGKPLANVVFKTYGYISMVQALTFLSDFKLGHYMKIPPRSMFLVQLVGTVIASSVYFGTAWWLLTTVEHICDLDLLPEGSPWTCPGDDVFYNASVIWGVIGPLRMFGRLGVYPEMNWFFLAGLLAPVPVWFLSRKFPNQKWIRLIHMPIIIGATGNMPPARAVHFVMWGIVGVFFNFYVYNRYRQWWAKHTYILSAALDAGVAFMGIIIFFALQSKDIFGVDWWGLAADDHCPLASCPTAPGVVAEGCPTI